jgi:methylmalonyl-CoA mutase
MDNVKTSADERLFQEFPPVTTGEWEEKIIQDLKGADYEKKLIWKTPEGVRVKPYYRAEDLEAVKELQNSLPGQFPFLRGNHTGRNDWKICQDIETADTAVANAQAREALAKGAEAVSLNVQKATDRESLARLLEGIDTEKSFLLFNSSKSYPAFAETLAAVLGSKAATASGSFDFDPVSYLLQKGNFHTSEQKDLGEAAELLKKAGDLLPGFRAITVNGDFFHNAGSTLVQELAFSLASGNEYLALLTGTGFEPGKAAAGITFNFAAGSNYFMEIAKLRAARLLWARIVEQYKPASADDAKMHIHVITANFNKTIYDPHVNLLRTTTEAMSAAIGGADVITVLPFDIDFREPDAFSMRLARNQQILLKEESNLDKVIDPSAGSYYIDSLSMSVAEAAWELFLKVEDMGGMVAAVKAGFIQATVAESARQRNADIASRKTVLLGTNQYPNLSEKVLDRIQAAEEEEETEAGPVPIYRVMETYRGADAFEDLRLATEIYTAEEGHRPHVFLFTTGNLAMRKARAGFSTNFFGCAGYTITDNAGFSSVEDGVKAAIDAEADIVVLCSSDEEYAEIAPSAARQLKAAKPEIQVVVAGYPKEILETLKEAGVDEFIHVRTNVLESLYAFQQKLGIML